MPPLEAGGGACRRLGPGRVNIHTIRPPQSKAAAVFLCSSCAAFPQRFGHGKPCGRGGEPAPGGFAQAWPICSSVPPRRAVRAAAAMPKSPPPVPGRCRGPHRCRRRSRAARSRRFWALSPEAAGPSGPCAPPQRCGSWRGPPSRDQGYQKGSYAAFWYFPRCFFFRYSGWNREKQRSKQDIPLVFSSSEYYNVIDYPKSFCGGGIYAVLL